MLSERKLRLFVALELPAGVRETLATWCELAVGNRPGIRQLMPTDLHVTLCFLGPCPAADVPAILEACERAIDGYPAASLKVSAGLWLPRRAPRVLAVALEDLDARLGTVQAKLGAALEAGGWYEREQRPFLAHATVARVRRGASVSIIPPEPPALAFEAGRVTLLRSLLSPRGARYEPLSALELGA